RDEANSHPRFLFWGNLKPLHFATESAFGQATRRCQFVRHSYVVAGFSPRSGAHNVDVTLTRTRAEARDYILGRSWREGAVAGALESPAAFFSRHWQQTHCSDVHCGFRQSNSQMAISSGTSWTISFINHPNAWCSVFAGCTTVCHMAPPTRRHTARG